MHAHLGTQLRPLRDGLRLGQVRLPTEDRRVHRPTRAQLPLRSADLHARRVPLALASARSAALAAAALATPSHPAAISPAAARRGGGGCTQGGRVDRGGCGGSRGSCVGGGSTLKITRMCDVTSPCCCRLGLCSVSARRFSQPAILGGFTFSREALRQTVLPKKGANSGS